MIKVLSSNLTCGPMEHFLRLLSIKNHIIMPWVLKIETTLGWVQNIEYWEICYPLVQLFFQNGKKLLVKIVYPFMLNMVNLVTL